MAAESLWPHLSPECLHSRHLFFYSWFLAFLQSKILNSINDSAEKQGLCCLPLGCSVYKGKLPAALANFCFLLWCCDNYCCVPPMDGLLPSTRMFPVIVAENAESRIRQEVLAGVRWQKKKESVWINTAWMPPNAASILSDGPNTNLWSLIRILWANFNFHELEFGLIL